MLIQPSAFTLALVALSAPAALAQSDSQIHVLDQEGSQLQILVNHAGDELATLRITDGTDVEETRVAANSEHSHRFDIDAKGAALRKRGLTLELLDSEGGILDTESTWVVNPIELPDSPSMTLTPHEIAVLQKRWRVDTRTRRALDALVRRCDARLTHNLHVPRTGGAWTQLYRCPDTGVKLQMLTYTTHRSPATGKIYSGSPYDEVIVTYRHKALGNHAFEFALAYQLTGNESYADRAEEILMTYCHWYPTYPLHDRFGTEKKDAGRAFSQTLEEAQWLVDLARARDLLRGTDRIDAYEDQQLHDNLFQPALEVVERNPIGIYNIQNWHNSAIFMVGVQTGNFLAAHEAAFGELGLEAQLNDGVQSDGIWLEGSLGYHFFTAKAILPMVLAANRVGVSTDYTRLKEMFTETFELMQPDFTLPHLNDGAMENFETGLRDEYEIMAALFPDDQRLDDPLTIFGRGNNLAAVLWGQAEIRDEDFVDVGSVHFPESNIAVLRSGTYEGRSMATLDYGQHGGYHGHYDKLGLTVWMKNTPVIRESGADGLGTDTAEIYFRSTLAHSTVVVDGLNQEESKGTTTYFDDGFGTTVSAQDDLAYPGVTQRRVVHMTEEGHLADLFEVRDNDGTTSHTFDYVLHGVGSISNHNLTTTAGSVGFTGAYTYLKNVQTASTDGDIEITFTEGGKQSTVRIAGAPGTEVFLVSSPGFPYGSTHPAVIVRRQGTEAQFSTMITEGATIVPGFQSTLVGSGWEQQLEVQRPGVTNSRYLSFDQAPTE